MITSLVRSGLRLIAVVALFVLVFTLIPAVQAPKLAQPESSPQPLPVQTYTVPAEALPPKPAQFDVPEVVVAKPKPVTKPQAATPRKPSTANVKPRVPSWSVGAAQSYARGKVSSGQFACLLVLWNRESSWNYHAYNAGSGAYGIPQALPGSKMSTFGSDWRDNYKTQINWGLSYISGRYGTPCSALAHSNAKGWY